MARKYSDKDIVSIGNDRDRVRQSPTLYIPSKQKDGAVHIVFEIVDNSIDELSTKDTVGRTLTLMFDKKTYECTIIDDGSGIPHGMLLESMTVLATSGKFNNGEDSAYIYSGGAFGHGAKLAVFLSTDLEVTSMRDGKYLTYVFKDGILKDTKTGKSKEHGTITRFHLDRKFVAVDEVDPKDLQERLYEKSFLFPDIQMNFIVLDNGKETKHVTFEGNTLKDLVKKMKPTTDIVHVEATKHQTLLKQVLDDKPTDVKVVVDASLAYLEAALDADTDAYIISYANSIKTYDGGTAVEGMKLGVVKFFKEYAIPKLPKKDKELPITPTDMTSGLCGVVSVKISKPEFSAQHKARLTNQEVKFAVRDAVYETLCEQKNSVINQMVDFVKRVTRGRIASKKTRKKDVENSFSNDRPDKYEPIIYNMSTAHPELIIVEGDSAKGLASSARDPHNQALYSVRKPTNNFDADSDTVLSKAKSVFNDLCDIANIEPGKNCDPEKCVFEHIWGLQDGDWDGDAIFGAVFAFFFKHCRPIVDAGIIGRILPPAYSFPVAKGKKQFIRSKREFFQFLMKKFVKDVTVGIGSKTMEKGELHRFLEINFDYGDKLEKLANRYCCEPKFMEYIAWKYHGNAQSQTKAYWTKAMKPYGEIKVLTEDKMIVLDGELPGFDFINLAFDDTFDKHVKKFKEIQAMNDRIDGFTINGEKDKTLYDVMKLFRSYMPKGVKRFKGLGELEVKDLAEICMDPATRTCIVLRSKNYEDDLTKISVVMSSKEYYQRARTDILSRLRLDPEDLDT